MAYPILAPNSTWYKSTVSRSTITEINIVDSYSGGTADETWNADADNSGAVKCYRTGTVLTIAGNGSGKIAMNADSSYLFSSTSSSNRFKNVTVINGADLLDASAATTFERMFQSCEKLTYVNVANWNTGNVTKMATSFSQCYALTAVDVSNWNTSQVTAMNGTFQASIKLQSLDLSRWDVKNVQTMKGMFMSTASIGAMALSSIGDTSNWNTSSCTDMSAMFQMCSSLENVGVTSWDTSRVTDFADMFRECSSLSSLDAGNWDMSNATTLRSMFNGCSSLTSLDVSNWDVGEVTIFANAFSNCSKLTALDVSNWNTSSCTDMEGMFYSSYSLGTIDVSNWNVSKVTTFDHFMAHSGITLAGDGVARWVTSAAKTMDAMLYSCQNEVLDVSNFDTSNVLTFNQMFESCTKLKKIIGLENFHTSASQDFSEMFWNCPSLEELNLSAFDTRNATDGADRYGRDGEKTTTMIRFFPENIGALKKVVLGKNFSFDGDGATTTNIAVLPTPSGGMWYNANGEAFAPSDVPDKVNATYFSGRGSIDSDVLMKYGTLTRLADALRNATGETREYTPAEMADRLCAILNMEDVNV